MLLYSIFFLYGIFYPKCFLKYWKFAFPGDKTIWGPTGPALWPKRTWGGGLEPTLTFCWTFSNFGFSSTRTGGCWFLTWGWAWKEAFGEGIVILGEFILIETWGPFWRGAWWRGAGLLIGGAKWFGERRFSCKVLLIKFTFGFSAFLWTGCWKFISFLEFFGIWLFIVIFWLFLIIIGDGEAISFLSFFSWTLASSLCLINSGILSSFIGWGIYGPLWFTCGPFLAPTGILEEDDECPLETKEDSRLCLRTWLFWVLALNKLVAKVDGGVFYWNFSFRGFFVMISFGKLGER